VISYLQQIISSIELYGLFLVWSLGFFALLRDASSGLQGTLFVGVSCLIAGPVMLAVFLWAGMWLAPGRDPGFWIVLIWALPLGLLLFRGPHVVGELATMVRAWRHPAALPFTWVFLLLTLLPFLMLLPQLALLPVQGNDPLEYMQLGRVIYESTDTSEYPYLDSQLTGGFVAPWTHPPTYGVLIALAYMLQEGSAVAGAAKMIGLWFGTALSLLCAVQVYLLDRRMSWRVVVVPILVFTLPLFFQLVQGAHIDALRVSAFTLAILAVSWAIIHNTNRNAAFAGLSLAAALCTHSIGFLAPVVGGAVIMIVWQRGIGTFARFVLVAGLLVLAIGMPHYVRNIFIFGNPIQDNVAVWQLPQLRIAEFLQTTRGLETLGDRFWHGVFMPLTRPQEFGYLVVLLSLVLAWLLVSGSVGRRLARLSEFWVVRQEQGLFHIGLAICVFVFLLVASVFAGSELAIKNARYLLTIVPLCLIWLMVLIGHLDPDASLIREPFARLVRVPARWFSRWLPAVARVSDGNALPNGETTLAHGSTRLDRLVVLVVVLTLFAAALHQLYLASRASFAVSRLYIGSGEMGIAWNRIGDSELLKWQGSLLPEAILETATSRIVPAGEKVLVFRQASFGFYRVAAFRFYLDRDLLHLFEHRDPKALWRDLIGSGFTWITVPEYSMAEIQNSAFASLLRDPTLLQPRKKVGGWTLYEVRREGQPVETVLLADSVVSGGANRQPVATTESGSGEVDGVRAKVRADSRSGLVEFTREPGFFKRLDRWDAVLYRPVKTGLDPEAVNAADFHFGHQDDVLFEAVLSGQGLAEVAIEYSSDDIPGAGLNDAVLFPMSNESGEVERRRVQRQTIWTGTLDREASTVGGWFLPLPSVDSRKSGRAARVIFRLRDGRTLRVHGWSAKAVRSDSILPEVQLLRDIVERGWLIASNNGMRSTTVHVDGSAARKSMIEEGRFVLSRASSAPLLISPPMQVFAFGAEQAPLSRLEARELLEVGNLAIFVEGVLRGRGELAPTLAVLCSKDRTVAPESYAISLDAMSLTNAPGQRTTFREALPPVYLLAREQVLQQWSVRVPCIPAAARLVVESRFSRVQIPESYRANPDDSRRGEVGVTTLTMRIGAASTKSLPASDNTGMR
jgi:hypothetical protein